MESVVSVNQNMNNPPLRVGVLVAPDSHYKPRLYSDAVAQRNFNLMSRDIYQSVKHSKNRNEKKTPLSVFVFLGLGLLAFAFPFIRKIFKK